MNINRHVQWEFDVNKSIRTVRNLMYMIDCGEPVNLNTFDLQPSRCRSRGLLLQLATSNDTHTHKHIHTYSAGFHWKRDRHDLTKHNTHKTQISTPRRNSNPQSQQTSGRRPTQPPRSAAGRGLIEVSTVNKKMKRQMWVRMYREQHGLEYRG